MKIVGRMRRSRNYRDVLRIAAIATILMFSPLAFGDWDPGDPAIYYQLPDPTGWDVYAEWQYGVADDWTADSTMAITDIHFWGSWKDDIVGSTGDILLRIRSNDTSGYFARPGNVLWESVISEEDYTTRLYTTGNQGWYDPRWEDRWYPNNHEEMYQYNIDYIEDPFIQEEGETYWLEISMDYYGCHWGWKTAEEVNGSPAVFWDTYGYCGGYWQQLKEPAGWCWPSPPQYLDVAFVLTPEPATLLLLVSGIALIRKKR
ncbi:MAG: PEP-CTERM sorting domain-containing protein [Sedimentisphaerales bacterium]|nr:PEP-CTERM sorting domain-containing protein [Sedimentisphaerales bacterium]